MDSWNDKALKMLDEGDDTHFYELGDLVIIDAQQPPTYQPYVDWAKEQPGMNLGATITMVKKGGAFDPGKIRAFGVANQASFEAAIKRISKKKVEY